MEVGGGKESQDALLFVSAEEYPDLGLPAIPGLVCSGLCCPCRPTQDGSFTPPGHQPVITSLAPWALTPACPPASSPGGGGGLPQPLLSPGGQLSGALAAGLQVSLLPATRRKLFELARAFSEKTKMRKSKRKHLLKHQSYPFWPGTGWGQSVLRALRPWAGLPKAIPSSKSGAWVCGPPFSMSPAASLLSHLSVPVLTTMTRLGEKASI